MTEENEPVYVRYVKLTPKGEKLFKALEKMLEELQSSEFKEESDK